MDHNVKLRLHQGQTRSVKIGRRIRSGMLFVKRNLRQTSSIEIMIDEKQRENLESLKYLGSMIRNNARCKHEITSRISQHPARTKLISPANWTLREKLVLGYICNITLYGAEMWTLRKVDQKYLKSLDLLLEKDAEDQLGRSCEKGRSITKRWEGEKYPTYSKKRKADWTGHILCRKLPCKICYWRKIRERRKRKKT